MTTSVSQQIPPPKNWQDFESLCADLWTRIWKDPDTQLHGRQGQAQHGVDVYGRPEQGQEYAGVQCKGKDVYNHKEVTEAELRGEVKKAKKFQPAIKHFTLTTTAPNDVKIQAVARAITEKHRKEGLFDVVVLGWDEIQRRLADYAELIDKHYPEIGPAQYKTYETVERVEASLITQEERFEQRHQEVLDALKALGVSGISVLQDVELQVESKVDEALNAEIDGYRDLLNKHQISVALDLLGTLKVRVWDEASDAIKFRIVTNVAAAKSRLGRIEEAANEFVEAAKYNPADETAACNIAFGYLLLHEDEKANAAAVKAVQEHPDSSRAYSLLVASLGKDINVDDPTTLVPHEQLEKAEVAYTISHVFRMRNRHAEANEWIERALLSDDKSLEVRASAGASLLEPLLNNESIAYSGQLTDDQEQQIQRSRDLLTSAWEEVKETDEAAQYVHVAANLANLERLTKNIQRAREIIDEALRVNPELDELIRLKIIIELKNESFEAALSVSENIDVSRHKDVVMMQAEALFDLGRSRDALEKLEEITCDKTSNYYDDANALRLYITRKEKGIDAAITQANELLKEHPENIRLLCVLTGFYREKEDTQNVSAVLEKVKLLIIEKTDYRDRKLAADSLFYSGNYQDALPLYEDLITKYKDSNELRHMLVCLMELDQRQTILSIFSELDKAISDVPFFLKMAGAIHQRIGELDEARNKYDEYIEQLPRDLNVRLAWIEVCEKLEDNEVVSEFLDAATSYDDASPEDIVRLAHVLVDYGRANKGLLLAYENRRTHFDNPAAHFGYMGLLLFKSKNILKIEDVIEVAVDTAFTLEDKDGGLSTYIIESSDNRNRQIGELSPEDKISVNAIGKKNQEDVIVAESHLQNEVRKIVSIRHKYIHALHESMARFQELFPEHKEMTKVTLGDSEDPNEKLAPIFQSVSQRQDHILQVEELYISNHLPLAAVAKLTGSHPIDVWRSFMGRHKSPFNVCIGTLEERNQAFEIIEENTNGYVIDPITLFAICILNVQEAVVAVTGQLGITQSTLDILQRLVEERGVNADGYLSLSKEGDQYYKHEITKEDIEKDIAQIKSVLAWAQSNCEIIPAIGAHDIPMAGVRISETIAPAFIDTMLAAQGTGRVLLSDDMHLRMWSKGLFSVSGIWLQPILMTALDKREIASEVYYESIVTLVESNYYFTSIDANILLYLAEKQDYEANQKFERIASILGRKHSEFRSSLIVSLEFLARLWGKPIWVLWKEKYLYMMLNILTKKEPAELHEILNLLLVNANRISSGLEFINIANQDQYRKAIVKWCIGHFIRLNR